MFKFFVLLILIQVIYVKGAGCSVFGSLCSSCTQTACTYCPTGIMKDGRCYSCGEYFENCDTCTNSSCTNCFSGYVLSGGSCQKCATGCKTCSSDTSCSECEDGYYLNGLSCSKCSSSLSNCITCSSASTCTLCDEGYHVSASTAPGKCVNYGQVSNCVYYEAYQRCKECKKDII